MNLVNPQRFLTKGVKPQGKPYEETKNEDYNFPLFQFTPNTIRAEVEI
jgi:hypothetical protein